MPHGYIGVSRVSVLGSQLMPQMLIGGNAGLFMMGILHVARITDADDDNSAHIADTSEDIDLAAPHASPQHHCRPHPYHEKTDGKLLHVAIILIHL